MSYYSSNILKKDFTLDYTDYEKLKIAEQYNKLYSNIYEGNKQAIIENDNTKIYNMSLMSLSKKASDVYIKLVNELSNYFSDQNKKDINKLGLIITKDDNLLYIGILILIIAFMLWIIDITN